MKQAALLVNLGSPASTSVKDVRKYLDEFLMDGRVIDYPYLFRALLIKGVILRKRPEQSAEAYKSIWTEEGSPLIALSKKLQAKVQDRSHIPVGLAMRYAEPSIQSVLDELLVANPDLESVYIIPLYPQYAMSSYETVVEKVKRVARKKRFSKLKLGFHPPFYNDERYIKEVADSMRPHLDKPYNQILFSYHGVPERHIRKSDKTKGHCKLSETCCKTDSPAHTTCYRHQCLDTTRRIAEELGLTATQYTVSYQSRLGRDPWLEPSTANVLKEFGRRRMEQLIVISPAFVTDCLETLEELQIVGAKSFLGAGGKKIEIVPCLNDRDGWADILAAWIEENTIQSPTPAEEVS